jgi:uncharacterized protein (TIGR00251 family)
VRVAAPPIEGRANKALCKLLAKAGGVPRTSVEIVHGEGSRDKLVRLPDEAAERLGYS